MSQVGPGKFHVVVLVCLDAALEAYVSEMHLLFVNSMKISNTFRPANASTTVFFYKFRSTGACKSLLSVPILVYIETNLLPCIEVCESIMTAAAGA